MKEVMIAIALALTLTLIMFFYLFMPYGNNWKVVGTSHSYNLEEVKKKMSYHGTNVAYVDEDGNWWFFNEKDEKCKLR